MENIKGFLSQNSDRDFFEVSGSDATKFLQGMLSCDLNHLKNQISPVLLPGLICDSKGRVVSPALLFKTSPEDVIILALPRFSSAAVLLHLERHLVSEDVEIKRSYLFKKAVYVFGHPSEWSNIEEYGTNDEGRFYSCVKKSDYYEVNYDRAQKEIWLNSSELPPNIELLSDSEFAAYRVKNDILFWGIEIMPGDFAFELPFGQCISYLKGCYVGQESVSKAKFRGSPAFCYCRIEGEAEIGIGAEIFDGPNKVGKVLAALGNVAHARIRSLALKKSVDLLSANGVRIIKLELLQKK